MVTRTNLYEIISDETHYLFAGDTKTALDKYFSYIGDNYNESVVEIRLVSNNFIKDLT